MMTIPVVVYVLMVTCTGTRVTSWCAENVTTTLAECKAAAPVPGTHDTHDFPVKWKCVAYRR